MKKILVISAMLLLFSVLAFATGQKGAEPAGKAVEPAKAQPAPVAPKVPTKKIGGILKVAIEGEPSGLDTAATTGSEMQRAVWCSQEYLFDLDQDFKVAPQLAERWELSSNGLTLTFTLRKGVPFHNGKEMTSADVLASWKRGQEMQISSTKFANVDKMEAPDPYTFKVTLKQPASTFLEIMAGQVGAVPILPKEIAETTPAGKMTVEKVIGTGPYKLAEWRKGSFVRLVKFADYKGPREQYFDEILLIPVTETSARLSGVLAGDYHIALNIPVENYKQIAQNPSVVALKDSLGSSDGLFLNHAKYPLSNQKIRQALLAALNMEEILMAVVGSKSFFTLNPSWVAESSVFRTNVGKELGLYNQNNPEKAKQLLKDAGYNNEPIILMPIMIREFSDAALVVYEQLRKAGFNVKITAYDNATVREVRANPERWDVYFSGIRNVANPYPLAMFFNPSGYMHYKNDSIAAKWNAMLADPDLQKRIAIWKEIEKEIYTDVPFIKYGDNFLMHVVSKKIGGWRIGEDRASNDLVFNNAWFVE